MTKGDDQTDVVLDAVWEAVEKVEAKYNCEITLNIDSVTFDE